ncbi:hypothetical protein [Streptomyces natalensis]|nr:hypothetical protein [Streptomyces natalensis]
MNKISLSSRRQRAPFPMPMTVLPAVISLWDSYWLTSSALRLLPE